MRIHALASMPHYAEHISAIHQHLPAGLRGDTHFVDARLGQQVYDAKIPKDDIIMVASFQDVWRAGRHRVIYVEHGAGQSYSGVTDMIASHYHGGQHPDHVIAYLGPRQEVIDAWGRPGFACGSPVCDPYELFGDESVVAITFHWPGSRVCPEAGTAFEHYVDQLPQVVEELGYQGLRMVGHAHPRFGHLERFWKRIGVQLADVHQVRLHAGILICDNSSLAYEMAYLGRSVISLNCPEYRRDVNHGLRFWDAVPGLQVDSPDELIQTIRELPSRFARAGDTTDAPLAAYGQRLSFGDDGLRAAAWLTGFVGSL